MKKIISIIAVAFVAMLLVSCSTKKELDSLAGTRWGWISTDIPGEQATITFTPIECMLTSSDGLIELCFYSYVKPIVTIYPPEDEEDEYPITGTVNGNEMCLYFPSGEEIVFKKL